jgi:hypothetical protein
MQKYRLQKMCQRELVEKMEEEERDYWFNRLWPMTRPKQTWWEKCLAKEEGSSNSDSGGEEASKVTPPRGEDNPGLGERNLESGNCNSESGNCHPDSGNSNPGKENDWQGEVPVPIDVSMVFTIPVEFRPPIEDVMKLALGAECAVFKKPKSPGTHMKPLFI